MLTCLRPLFKNHSPAEVYLFACDETNKLKPFINAREFLCSYYQL